MPTATAIPLQARKSPTQARSTASVEAILTATVQVLLDVGADSLTTTRVAHRAGVSVGTLYQYFPNKSSLLQAVLRRHLESVAQAVETVCLQQRGASLEEMARHLVQAFLDAKLQDPRISVALYRISGDLDAARIVAELALRSRHALTALLQTSPQPVNDPAAVAPILLGAMYGISRQMLERKLTPADVLTARTELTKLTTAYLQASVGH